MIIELISWVDLIKDSSNGIFTLKENQIHNHEEMDTIMEELDIKTATLGTTVEAMEERSDALMNNIISESGTASIIMMGLTAFVGVVAIVVGLVFARSITKPIGQITDVSTALAEGDLTKDLERVNRSDEIGVMSNAFNEMISFLRPIISDILKISESVASSAQELASSTEEVNASSEELSAIAQQISTGSQKQSSQLSESVVQADNLQTQFSDKIKGIQKASDLIESIAGQVNMLALNASIEAARAGEYGRGFAVVAENVRSLADEAKSSVTEVHQIITDLYDSVMGEIAIIKESLSDVSAVAEETASGAEEASASTEEQTATMEEMSSSAQELATVAVDLENFTKRFKI
jgi:methyl-accepting chemotaxis protein